MPFRYNYLPDVAIADAAFAVEADSWNDLFAGATEALTAVMVTLDDLGSEVVRELEVSADSVEQLLHDWLSEIVYLKDTEGLLVKSVEVAVVGNAEWQARGTLRGDRIDRVRQRLGQDVKAVTYHLYKIKQDRDHYSATVVLDI
jgi:SHS2 domain-containing protein